MKKEELLKELENECLDSFGCSINEASKLQVYKTLCTTVRDMLARERKDFTDKVTAKEEKQVYYMSSFTKWSPTRVSETAVWAVSLRAIWIR